ncbi:phosphatidylserine decarboxylase [Aspergillus foveolatus]|uniref:phosphatidylserine decarboxylase n=1 Tax=Aspergillus foveolatus TaxID=210207 RepID=UPI003CCDCBB4
MTGALIAHAPGVNEPTQAQLGPGLQGAANDYEPLVRALEIWITSDPARKQSVETAVRTAQSYNVPEMQHLESLDSYLQIINGLLRWVPAEAVRPRDLLLRTATMWFVLDQPSVLQYQSPIRPFVGAYNEPSPGLTWLSRWIVSFSNQFGRCMDTPASAAKLDTFRSNPAYRVDDYIEPRGGWKTFNEFFARQVKPSRRPIEGIADSTVVTSTADFKFVEMHRIMAESTVTIKGTSWPITHLLAGSPYKDRFAKGIWLHGCLNVDDYHRVHAPVAGTVLESQTIHGQSYMQLKSPSLGVPNGPTDNELSVLNELGRYFCQSRGLVVIDTGFGLVAVVPVSTAVLPSVILTAEVGTELHKGEELGYFHFGGSDVVLIFEDQLNFNNSMEEGKQYQMGRRIGRFGLSRE